MRVTLRIRKLRYVLSINDNETLCKCNCRCRHHYDRHCVSGKVLQVGVRFSTEDEKTVSQALEVHRLKTSHTTMAICSPRRSAIRDAGDDA